MIKPGLVKVKSMKETLLQTTGGDRPLVLDGCVALFFFFGRLRVIFLKPFMRSQCV